MRMYYSQYFPIWNKLTRGSVEITGPKKLSLLSNQ